MVLSFIGGLLFGSGIVVLFSGNPIYPKTVAGAFIIVGAVMMAVGISSA